MIAASLPESFRSMTMMQGVRAAMRREPGKTAATFGDQRRTYAELVERSERLCDGLINGFRLGPNQNVAIVAKNCIEYLEVTLGAPEAGLAVATVNPRMTAAELKGVCDDAQAKVVFCDVATAPLVRAAGLEDSIRIVEFGPAYEALLDLGQSPAARPAVEEWDVWTIPYTSGTTGKPKGVLLSHRSRVLVGFMAGVEFGCFGPDDIFLAMTPMNHGGGLGFPISTLLSGGTVDIMDKFDAHTVLHKLKYEGVTGLFMVPTHFHIMFDLPEAVLAEHRRPATLKAIIANAAPLPQAMKEKIVPYFGEQVLNEIYSSTEMGLVSNLRPQFQLEKLSCVGLPFAHVAVKVLNDQGEECAPDEVGEVFVSSPGLFNGYWNNPEETTAAFRDGWLSVGDMARRDADGFLYIADRKKDMVISGGVNIYPREVEEVLLHHPAVAEVAVVGVPDEKWGERLKAFVVPHPGHAPTSQELADFCQGKLAAFKIPREAALLEALPRNANGKVLKRELRSR